MTRSVAEQRGDALSQLEELGRCNVPNACVLMNIHHHTLRAHITSGAVQAFWIGKRPWVTQEEIERFQNEGKRPVDSAAPQYGEAELGGA